MHQIYNKCQRQAIQRLLQFCKKNNSKNQGGYIYYTKKYKE